MHQDIIAVFILKGPFCLMSRPHFQFSHNPANDESHSEMDHFFGSQRKLQCHCVECDLFDVTELIRLDACQLKHDRETNFINQHSLFDVLVLAGFVYLHNTDCFCS